MFVSPPADALSAMLLTIAALLLPPSEPILKTKKDRK
jgi:hypothetical protein